MKPLKGVNDCTFPVVHRSECMILIIPSEHGYRWRLERDGQCIAEGMLPSLINAAKSAVRSLINEWGEENDQR